VKSQFENKKKRGLPVEKVKIRRIDKNNTEFLVIKDTRIIQLQACIILVILIQYKTKTI